ncbi:unnamed protein product [Pleuronectes platessa]|uniref:Uncharacterized protein n=1 Tax=Pleuronectes platessa TaxID=8262 RepID=A0A9N7TGM3_PLEPL|nr:unnamed protein product [Pleuronectes platessa]
MALSEAPPRPCLQRLQLTKIYCCSQALPCREIEQVQTQGAKSLRKPQWSGGHTKSMKCVITEEERQQGRRWWWGGRIMQEIRDPPRISVRLEVFSFHGNKVAYQQRRGQSGSLHCVLVPWKLDQDVVRGRFHRARRPLCSERELLLLSFSLTFRNQRGLTCFVRAAHREEHSTGAETE